MWKSGNNSVKSSKSYYYFKRIAIEMYKLFNAINARINLTDKQRDKDA